jgi:hypothetical protein
MPPTLSLAPAEDHTLSRPEVIATITPGMTVAALLLVCCIKGLWMTGGLEVPTDPDTVRDLGFIQGFLDGNWFTDPATDGAWRWYPPLWHALAALVVGGLRLPLFATWLHAGAFLNLLAPLSFYFMNRRLIGAWPAATATMVFVLFDSVVMPGDATAGYTPWTLTPALAWPLFFGSVWLIAERIPRLHPGDAALIGLALGLTFLAHTVPAVLLSGIAAAAALATHGPGWRTLRWLGIVAAVECLVGAPFVLPLLLAYRLHIVNLGPGAWVHPVLTDISTLLPNGIGGLALGWLLARHAWTRLAPATTAILGAWIALCLGFLGRHYVCSLTGHTGGACGVFVVAAHHYHVYLQAAWASLAGLALVELWVLGRRQDLIPLAVLATLAGVGGFLTKPEDAELRRLGSARPELILDRSAYDWIIAETNPADLFVTELPPDGANMGPAAATVMAAGRRLVAPPAFHSNPYVAWAPMNARRLLALSPGGGRCALLRQAGGHAAFLLLPSTRIVGRADAPVFSSAFNTIYRVSPDACARDP